MGEAKDRGTFEQRRRMAAARAARVIPRLPMARMSILAPITRELVKGPNGRVQIKETTRQKDVVETSRDGRQYVWDGTCLRRARRGV